MDDDERAVRVYADFNGLFGDVLCLSHGDTCKGADGSEVLLREGMIVTAFDNDVDDSGNPDDLIATGTVEHSPYELRSKGSSWSLRVDENGVRHESDLKDPK